MKVNKKAILAMLVTMIMSLGMMGGINGNSQDSSLQQVSIGCAWIAGETEVGPDATSAWSRASDITGGICVGMAVNGAYHAYATSTNPVGWGYWAVTGLFGL